MVIWRKRPDGVVVPLVVSQVSKAAGVGKRRVGVSVVGRGSLVVVVVVVVVTGFGFVVGGFLDLLEVGGIGVEVVACEIWAAAAEFAADLRVRPDMVAGSSWELKRTRVEFGWEVQGNANVESQFGVNEKDH